MYAPAERLLRGSVHRSLAPGSVVGSDPLRAGRDPDAGVDFFLNYAAVGIPDFSVKAQPQRHSPQRNKKIRPQPDRGNSFSQASGGETGIRTLETVSRLHAFQACAFDHSATSPFRRFLAAKRRPVQDPMRSVEVDVDAPVPGALLLDLAEPEASDLAGPRDMGAAA